MRPVARMPAIPPNETAAVPPASLRTLRRLVLIILSSQDYRLVGRLHLVGIIVDFRQQRAQVGPRNFPSECWSNLRQLGVRASADRAGTAPSPSPRPPGRSER